MSRIRHLDPHVINKIAAGEVIERPASVVKELLENSIDALATRIEIEVAAGGTELLRLVDDGEGIHPDDLPLAVASHATSKLADAEDLFRVRTMGFRGEALASIAAVSRLRVRSRQRQSDAAQELEVVHGRIGDVRPCSGPVGTLVEVRHLFANTPVRRKFLKTVATEFSHLCEQFTRIAIAHPRLHLVLRHNGNAVYELPATNRLLDRVQSFHGGELAENLIAIESQTDAVRLWGYVGHPSQSRSSRKGQYLFLNGRWIQDRALQHALGEAYRGLLMTGRYPIAFLFLEMPPELVDVNVHPTKAEVRFRDGQQHYRHLLATLRTKFLGMNLDSKLSVPGETAAPSPAASGQQLQLERELVDWAKDQLGHWEPSEPAAGLPPAIEAPPMSPLAVSPAEPNAEAIPTDSPSPPFTARVMQVHDCYIVTETEQGLTVIDQHALHERVLYEQLRRRALDGAVESQRLLVPTTIEMNPAEAALVLEHRELLGRLGIGIEEFGGGTLLLTAYPAMLPRADHARLLRDVAERLAEAGQTPSRRDILDSLLHMMACRAAIKAGQRLTAEEMHSLLAYRHLIDDAHHCPHGRPTALVLSRQELDRQFGRLG